MTDWQLACALAKLEPGEEPSPKLLEALEQRGEREARHFGLLQEMKKLVKEAVAELFNNYAGMFTKEQLSEAAAVVEEQLTFTALKAGDCDSLRERLHALWILSISMNHRLGKGSAYMVGPEQAIWWLLEGRLHTLKTQTYRSIFDKGED